MFLAKFMNLMTEGKEDHFKDSKRVDATTGT